jgi:hypothetical protein
LKNKVYFYLFIALVVLYLGLQFGLPVSQETLQQHNLTEAKAKLIYATISLPFAGVWLAAMYSFRRFKSYAELVKNDKEGPAFMRLADGLTLLAFSLPLTSLTGTILTYLGNQIDGFEPTSVIIRNYVTVILQLVAFILLSQGAGKLWENLRPKVTERYPKYWSLIIIVVSSLFTWIITARALNNPNDEVYYLPAWLIVTTLTIPYLIAWYKGGLAIWRLHIYSKKVKGLVYKEMLGKFVAGMTVIVGLAIVLRLLVTISERLSRLNVTPLLIIIYVLVAFYILGYGLVARGARQLKKIEEV